MKTTRSAVAILLVLAGALAALPAVAGGYYHRGYWGGPRVSIGFGFGYPYAAYPYYYPPAYAPYYPAYYPAPVVVQRSAPVYIEQSPQQPTPSVQPSEPQHYWYYCAESNAYYPYAKECAAGWQRVAPQPG